MARSFGDMVVTHHELATQAGLEMLQAGGNAVDAAVAANAVTGVVLPTACGPGGDLFALIHAPGADRPETLNSSGLAGSGADADALRQQGLRRVPLFGPEPVTIPGCVDGWEALLERRGTMQLTDVLGPAIRHARDGFPSSVELAASLERIADLVRGQLSAEPLYPGGRAPRPGERVVRADLADTLQELGEGGREAFYLGRVGREIEAATSGVITMDDLAERQATWVEPLGADVLGRRAWTIPPNSQGYLTLAASWILERLDPPRRFDAAYLHALVEAYRAVAWERDDLVADSRFAPLPPERLVAADRLEPRAKAIDPDARTTWPDAAEGLGGTTYLCVVDRDGLAISLIQSNFSGIGSGLSAGATGVFLQNRGAGFNLEPGHPNEMAPGKRPLHTLSPTLWTDDGRMELVLGTRGGYQQPQLLLQAAAHLFHLGEPPGVAQALPRWTLPDAASLEDPLSIEDRLPEGVEEGLERRGHRLERAGPFQGGWGPVSLIAVDVEGVRTGASDPRVESASAAGH